MTYAGEPDHHRPSGEPEGDPNRTCLYDGEAWPCVPKQIEVKVRAAVAAEILAEVDGDRADRPKWARGMRNAAEVARLGGQS